MVDEAVDRRHGHRRIGEDLVPRAEGLVAGRDQALALVTLGDELEQHGGLGLILADISEVIENQAIKSVELGERGWQRQVAPRRLQLLHEIGGAGEEDAAAGVDERGAERRREM